MSDVPGRRGHEMERTRGGDMRRVVMCLLFCAVLAPVGRSSAGEDPDRLYRVGRFAEAFEAYSREELADPKDLRHRFNRGCAAYQKEDYPGAQAAFASVFRRADDEEMRFRALFNLGNAAFKLEDFATAVNYYRQAVVMHPESEPTRRNLELALRELDKQEQAEQQEQDQPPQESQEGQQQQEQKSGQDKPSNGESEPQSQPTPGEQPAATPEPPPEEQAGETPAAQETPPAEEGQTGGQEPQEERRIQALLGMDQKKAEALLDNIQEDPARMLRFQIPKDKRGGPASGQDW